MRDPKAGNADQGATEHSPSRREAARTTIVGGQPEGNARDLPPIPVGLEHLMGLAAASPDFAEALERDRPAALAATRTATGLELSRSERGILTAVPTPALAQMVSRVSARLDAPDRRRFLEQAGLALTALLGASAGAGCKKKPTSSQSQQQGEPPARDQPGAPEDTEALGARDAAPPPPATPDAAAARPALEPPERPAAPGDLGMDAEVLDMAAMDQPGPAAPGMAPPASVAPLRERPEQPPPTKGIQPWRPRPMGTESIKTRGISPNRYNSRDDL